MLQPNCKKEGESWTYHNAIGYAPIFSYVGTHGYMMANEFRHSSQHGANGAVEFVTRCIKNARKIGFSVEKLLVRMDSGHDDAGFLKTLCASNVKFLAKQNLRNEIREQYLAIAHHCEEKISSWDGKNVYRCTLSHRKPNGLEDMPLFMIVEVIERLTFADGQQLLIPKVEVSAWWPNLPESEAICIELYCVHEPSEQLHSEFKTDMGLESLPRGKFATNAMTLNLAAWAYNYLRRIGQKALSCEEFLPVKLDVSRRRLWSVLLDLIYV